MKSNSSNQHFFTFFFIFVVSERAAGIEQNIQINTHTNTFFFVLMQEKKLRYTRRPFYCCRRRHSLFSLLPMCLSLFLSLNLCVCVCVCVYVSVVRTSALISVRECKLVVLARVCVLFNKLYIYYY